MIPAPALLLIFPHLQYSAVLDILKQQHLVRVGLMPVCLTEVSAEADQLSWLYV